MIMLYASRNSRDKNKKLIGQFNYVKQKNKKKNNKYKIKRKVKKGGREP